MRRTVAGLPALLAVLVAAGCTAPPAPTAAPAAHWSYEGEEGPAHWAELSPDFALCASGRQQSPIDIGQTELLDLPDITFDYLPAQLEIVNNGHTVQVNYPTGSSIELDGTRFDLLQFHFHAPSEHLVDGRPAAAELHLVHRSDGGALAVVGVLLTQGGQNPAFEAVVQALPAQQGPPLVVPGVNVDAAALLPATRTTYRYPGSLTTPPCSEGVTWLLMTAPADLSAAQLGALHAVLEGNARPVQPLNDRTVEEDSTP